MQEKLSSMNLMTRTENRKKYYKQKLSEFKAFLKNEFYLDQSFFSTKHEQMATKNGIKIYNNERLHLSLGYKTRNSVYKRIA